MELLLNNALFVCGFYFIIIILRKQCEQCLTDKNQLLHCYELINPITFMLCFKEHQISALSDLKAIYEIQKLFQRIVYMPNLTLVFDLLFSAFCPVTEAGWTTSGIALQQSDFVHGIKRVIKPS